MRLPSLQHRTVLITGCSSGIGLATAHHLRNRGWRVLATARRNEDVDRLRRQAFEAWRLDVADEGSVAEVAPAIVAHVQGNLGALVNNAGYGQAGAMEDISRATLRRQFETNVFGLQDLTNRILPVFRARGAGRIVHISSVLGRLTLPLYGSYCASKHAVEAMADAQRVELRGSGIGIILVEPGSITTEFRRNAARNIEQALDTNSSVHRDLYAREVEQRRRAQRLEDRFSARPEAVARVVERALTSRWPATRYPVTLPAHLGPLLRKMLPDCWFDAVMAGRMSSR